MVLTGDTRRIFVSKTVDESHSARVLIGCKPIRLVSNLYDKLRDIVALSRALALAVARARSGTKAHGKVNDIALLCMCRATHPVMLLTTLYRRNALWAFVLCQAAKK